MDFNLSDDRQMIADTLDRYLRDRYPMETRHRISASSAGWSAEQWATFAKLGIIGALFPGKNGGFGGAGFDIGVVFEQLGAALVVEPLLSVVMAGQILIENEDFQDIIDQVIGGNAVLAFAHEEKDSGYETAQVSSRATMDECIWRLTGAKSVVIHVEAAKHIIVSARISGAENSEHGIGLFLVEKGAPGYSVDGYPLIDGGRAGELHLVETPARLISKDGYPLLRKAMAAGIIALVWEAVGIMEVLKASTIEYLKVRKQFGVPIVRHQALRHRLVSIAMEIEQARSAAINAADAFDEPALVRDRAVAAAKFTIGRAGTMVAEEAIQMHGGIGMTWELPLAHFAKRLTMIGHQLGDEDHHLERFIELGRTHEMEI